MLLLSRFILIVALMAQTLTGFAQALCAAPCATYAEKAAASCCCCGGDDSNDSMPTCPMATQTGVCNCSAAGDRAPVRAPAPTGKSHEFGRALALMPIAPVLDVQAAPARGALVNSAATPLPAPALPSIQSLLCIWLT